MLQDRDVIEERAVEDSTTSVPGNLGRAAQVNAVRERIFLLARWDDLPFVCVPSSVILFVCLLFCCPMHSSSFSVCSNVLQDEPSAEDRHVTQDVHANLRRAAAADEVCPCIVCVCTRSISFSPPRAYIDLEYELYHSIVCPVSLRFILLQCVTGRVCD